MSGFTEETIFKYLDGVCSTEEKRRVEKELSRNEVFRVRFEQLKSVHDGMTAMSLERPPESLSDRVMEKLQTLPREGYSGYSGIFSSSGFLLVTGVLTALVAIIYMVNSGQIGLQSLDSAAEGYNLLKEWSYLKGVFSERILTNLMLVIYGALSIAVLDRIILDPIFRKKNKQFTS